MKTFSRNNTKQWIISMIAPTVGLANESPIRNPPRFYLWAANVLSATALKSWDSAVYNKIVDKIVSVKNQYKIQCKSPYTLICDGDVVKRVNMTTTFQHNKDKVITEGTTLYYYASYDGATEFSSDAPYSNVQFLRAIDYYKKGKLTEAKSCYKKGLSFWDGSGFADKTFTEVNVGKYELYKYALYKIAKNITKFSDDVVKPPCALAAMNQDDKGAVYTHYKKETIADYKAGREVKRVSSTNTEVAPLCLIAGFSSTSI